ncbi:fasciculation and elongation protein zeta-2 [Xenentodon cancila]
MVRGMAAPVSHFDDVWPNLGDRSVISEKGLLPQRAAAAAGAGAGEAAPRPLLDHHDAPELCGGGSFSPGECGVFWSTDDPVAGFDETLSAAVGNNSAEMDKIVPLIDEDTPMKKDELWNALSSNCSHVKPLDWSRYRTCSLYISTFSLEEKPRKTDVAAELSDEEEVREQLDLHSIIIPCLGDEPLVTAEQVIEEIEEMMRDSSDMEAECNPSQSDLSMVSLDVQWCSPGFEERIRALSVSELMERLEEAEANIRRFSEELVQQLAIRDELDFEKEVKNCFISALIDVQNRQKEHRESVKKKKKLKGVAGTAQGLTERPPGSRFSMEGLSSVIQNSFRQTFGSGCSERQYLTTVIPYEKKGHPPSIEELQILTKILQAMRDDSDKVPSLLTDYILNVLCPT